MRKGYINIQQWIAFFLYAQTLSDTITKWVETWSTIKSAQGAASRLIDIMGASKEIHNVGKEVPAVLKGDIEFKNVTFAYGDAPVLSNVNATIGEGKATAIVGLCGSGKTTIISLIERLYRPASGEITIGEENIREFNIDAYRSHFAYVQQDAGIFSGTIREAMLYGVDREVPEEELIDAAKMAGAWDFIKEIPNGLDGTLAIGGSSVSGGQRQRIVLARELIKNKDVLLLDEPTSALDAETAREVQQTIFRLFKGKTIIMITHDLGLISSVDQIIVVNNGTIEACGTHDDLMKRCGIYHELVEERAYKEVYGE
jgi:ATP-binding cassette subfamily B protein AbcA/BmrA